MIEISNLVKKFGSLTAVDTLNLKINPGEIFGFLGPNGAGKTTTVKVMTGLLRSTSGTVTICGHDVEQDPVAAKRAAALVPDEPFVYPKLTGSEYLRFIAEIYGVPEQERRRRIPEILEMFELSAWAGELCESYSHGMRQKIVLAGALLRNPRVLILDEPLVGLDPKSCRLVKEIFLSLAKRGTAIFLCTHVLEIAEKLCGRVGIMISGSLAALGTLEELKQKAKSPRSGLEDVFLNLTGGAQYESLLKLL
ncbi:MAG: ABC transporter ATP-binding protein [Elusimicrobiota bacterium]